MTKDQQLYIDGILMDLGDDTEVTLDIKSNLFRDVSKMASNSTYTINLPKTAHNMAVLEFSGKPHTSTQYPFVFHSARYFRNGLEIIHNGRASVLSVSDTIEISIYFGLFPALTSLQSSELKLNELNCTKYLEFLRNNTIDTYENALKEGVFYATYDTAQVEDYNEDWVGYDTNQGSNSNETYELVEGKIRTGTSTGSYVSGEVISDSDYKCAIVEFYAGQRATMQQILGKGSYRTWAILDYNRNVLRLAEEPSDQVKDTFPTIPAEDPVLGTHVAAGTIVANYYPIEMSVISITIKLASTATDGNIEYGAYDPVTDSTEVWGTLEVLAEEELTLTLSKYKGEGALIYLKPSKDDILYWCVGTSGGIGSYYVSSDGKHTTSNRCAYSVRYTSDYQTMDLDVQAPSTSAWLVVNALKQYSASGKLKVTSSSEYYSTQEARASGGGSFGSGRKRGPVQPSVGCSYLLGLITTQTGVAFSWSAKTLEAIKGLAIPLISRKADGNTLDGGITATFFTAYSLGRLAFQQSKAAAQIFNEGETYYRYSQLTVKMGCTMVFDIQVYWSWDASDTPPQGYRNWSYEGSTESQGFYTYPPCYIEMKIVSEHEKDQEESEYTKTYVIGKQSTDDDRYNATITNTENEKVGGRFIHLMTGRGAIELAKGDIITFELKHPAGKDLRGLRCYNGTMTANLKQSEEVPYGGQFPIGKNLPEIKVLDFIKCLAVLTGTYPCQDFSGGTLRFADITSIWDDKSKAVDWSMKLIPSYGSNHPMQTDFSIEDYCQHNIYKWKEDDTVYDEHDADMVIDNDTLEYTQDTYTFPFAASDGNRVPIYEWENTEASFGSRTAVTSRTATKYKGCKDRIMSLLKNDGGQAALTFDIDLQAFFDTKLKKLRDAIANPHQVTERFNLSDIEILSFDETKPVYLAQYGCYFAVLEIKTTESGYCEVTMIEI